MASTRFSLRTSDVVWRTIEGEVVALNVGTSQYVSVNDSGSILWARLEGSATRDELVAALVERFDVGTEEATADVDEFLAALGATGLIDEAKIGP